MYSKHLGIVYYYVKYKYNKKNLLTISNAFVCVCKYAVNLCNARYETI